MTHSASPLTEGVYVRRSTRHTGFVFDTFAPESAWIRESAEVFFPPLPELRSLVVRGEFRAHPEARGRETRFPVLELRLGGKKAGLVAADHAGPWELALEVPSELTEAGFALGFVLHGTGLTNFFAWAGRVFAGTGLVGNLQRYRQQYKNRQLRITTISADGEMVYDFSNRHSPYSAAFARKHARIGLNVAGFFTADHGIGESARCMLRAADAAQIPAAAIALKIPCKARNGDATYAPYLQEKNIHAVNVFHLDPPASAEIDTHHGKSFRRGKYNIGYWAWELTDFPDAWVPYFDCFEEIWCPSEFARAAIADKSPTPVVTMPHAIRFERPKAAAPELRAKFGLPSDRFLFLFLYDLHSYSERKNPRAVLAAFRESGLAAKGASLVIKVHGAQGNEADLAALRSAVAEFPGTVLINEALARADLYALQAACDCFVSLHRSEGFGLAVAECMYLGKPVIATDWSATAEYLNADNGCPVKAKLITIERSHGPYSKGQTWADPDITHAADWMRRLHGDRALAAKLGEAARVTIERQFSPAAIGARYRRRLEAVASW